MIVTRFAPSPTGFLHIGGARTALFNWFFARRNGGRFLLRIDDTDRERSTQAAVDAIIGGLSWLGLDWDEGPIFQHARFDRHRQVAEALLASGHAYRCFATAEDLEAMRLAAIRMKKPPRYDGRWRERKPREAPAGAPFALRLKAPQTGVTIIEDQVLGRVEFANAELDDFVLLRSDGDPTYMLSTVVDDVDLGVTHVIRGNEHLVNAARQAQIYDAMGWPRPVYAHVPLIHGEDGAKLSKRHGAVGVEAYRDLGFLPDALADYLARLGWTPGVEDPLTKAELAERFDLPAIHRGPARFDLAKLTSINFAWMKRGEDRDLADRAHPFLEAALGRPLGPAESDLLVRAMPGLKERAKTLAQLAEAATFYFLPRPIPITDEALAQLDQAAKDRLVRLAVALSALAVWTRDALDQAIKTRAAAEGVGFPKLGQPLRAALAGRISAPGVSEMLELLGREEALGRIEDAIRPVAP